MTKTEPRTWLPIIVLGLTLSVFLAGCAQTETYAHEVRVQAASPDGPVPDAQVTARLGAREVAETTTDAEGRASFAFGEDRLDRWAKVVIEADGYQRKSILVKLLANAPPSVVQLEPPTAETAVDQAADEVAEAAETPAVEGVAPEQEEAAEANNPEAEVHNGAMDPGEGDPSPGPLAAVPPAERNNYFQAKPELVIDPDGDYRATIHTNKGDIVVSLNAEAAPEHVNNFIFLSNQGFYDGLTFHRVEPGFVIQGGDPQGSGQGGPGYTVPGEFELIHGEGALAMARLSDDVNPERESSGSQFYITLAPTPFLDGQYSVFGQVEAGLDIVQSIEIGDMIERINVEP